MQPENYNTQNLENTQPSVENPENQITLKPKKKSWFKRKKKLVIVLSVVFIIVLLIVIGALAGGKNPEYSTVTTAKGTLKQSVDATGKVESAETIELNFKTTGRIDKIYVKPGDEVKSGKLLAELEAGALSSSVADAQAQLNQALANHQELLAGASEQEIIILENKLEQERADLLAAEQNLENLKQSKSVELSNLKETALNVLNNELSTANSALEEIENTLEDSDAENTLSIENPGALVQAENSQRIAKEYFAESNNEINALSILSEDAEIITALGNLKTTLDKTAVALNDVLDVLSATLASSSLTETELDTLKSNITTKLSAISTARTNVITAKSNWTNKIVYYQDQIDSYEAAIQTAQNNFKIAQAELDDKKSPPRQFEIDASLAKVQQARANLSLNLAKLNDAKITAPVDGTITKKNFEAGEYASLASPVLEMIGESNLQIEVDIPESDIPKIQLGQDAEITLDAFTSDDVFAGKVVFIDPAETIISDVVYYKVKVQFNELENLKDQIKPGMTANVVICTNKKENVISVPLRAVKSENGDKYVEILTGTKNKPALEKRKIMTGLRGDEGVEIISGLQEGEEVVTFVKE